MNFEEIKYYIFPEYRHKVETWLRSELKKASVPKKNRPACPFHGNEFMEWDSSWYCSTRKEDDIICGFHPDKGKIGRKRRYTMRKGKLPNELKTKFFSMMPDEEILVQGFPLPSLSAFFSVRKQDGYRFKCRAVPEGVIIRRVE